MLQPCGKAGKVFLRGTLIAESTQLIKVMETSCPPVYYFPPEDVHTQYLQRSTHKTFCEWKGPATYWHIKIPGNDVIENAAWSYHAPLTDAADYTPIKNHFAFYAGLLACALDNKTVDAQASLYYGGWVTAEITGPFKGMAGSEDW
ncbi:MAG: DUF427 domain-containing protein [Alphaproteobacteria bacterium]|nr:DUF427 domain-containing protein [Alphaproteobacteria bacterium]